MSIEQSLGGILSQLRGERGFGFETVADQVAHGIDQSALFEAVKAQGGNMEAGLAGLAAALGIATREICRELRQSNSFLGELTNATLHPLETEAREQYRRGIHSLDRGWIEEAVVFLERAVEKSPISPEIWFSLALAQIGCDLSLAALASLERTIKYAVEDAPGVAAGAFLTLAGLKVDDADALEVLRRGASALPACAELHFALARKSLSTTSLTCALKLAPELAVTVQAVLPALADQVPAILHAPDGPATVAARLRSKITMFGATFTPAVPVKWANPEGLDDERDALAAAETFTYVRTHLDDLWTLARYGMTSGQRANIHPRSLLSNEIAAAATGLQRIRPWQPLDLDPAAMKPSSRRVLKILATPSGLIIPGEHPNTPEKDFIVISGELLALLERGDLPRAVSVLRERHPMFLSDESAGYVLEFATKELWG